MTDSPEEFTLSTTMSGKDVFADWDQLLQAPLFDETEMADMQLADQDQKHWEDLFNQMNFPGMDLMASSYREVPLDPPDVAYKKLQRTTRDFVRFLSYHFANDLRSAGVSEEGIFYMKRGQIPENYTVHMKYPIPYGGAIDFNNLVLIQAHPFHELIHLYLNKQILGPEGVVKPAVLYIPVPVGKVYVPMGLFTGSGGKNKQDRSVMSGFTQNALRDLALRSMPGR